MRSFLRIWAGSAGRIGRRPSAAVCAIFQLFLGDCALQLEYGRVVQVFHTGEVGVARSLGELDRVKFSFGGRKDFGGAAMPAAMCVCQQVMAAHGRGDGLHGGRAECSGRPLLLHVLSRRW